MNGSSKHQPIRSARRSFAICLPAVRARKLRIFWCGVATEQRTSSMKMLLSAVAAIAFGGLCSDANAQAQCPELTRLRGEAVKAQQPMRRGLGLSGCEEYIRSSLAWRAVL